MCRVVFRSSATEEYSATCYWISCRETLNTSRTFFQKDLLLGVYFIICHYMLITLNMSIFLTKLINCSRVTGRFNLVTGTRYSDNA